MCGLQRIPPPLPIQRSPTPRATEPSHNTDLNTGPHKSIDESEPISPRLPVRAIPKIGEAIASPTSGGGGIRPSAQPTTPLALLGKWTCRICTYANWPKSQKCVMCGALRPRSPTCTPSPTDRSPVISPSDNNEANHERRDSKGSLTAGTANATSDCPTSLQSPSSNQNDSSTPNILWLEACLGVILGDQRMVMNYLNSGGSIMRQLTVGDLQQLSIRPGADGIDPGVTLMHLAIVFKREEILAQLVSLCDPALLPVLGATAGGKVLTAAPPQAASQKRAPCQVATEAAESIARQFVSSIRLSKTLPCFFLVDSPTFSLPSGASTNDYP